MVLIYTSLMNKVETFKNMNESVASISVNSHSSTHSYIGLLGFIFLKISMYLVCYHFIPDISVLCVAVVYCTERLLITTSLNLCFDLWLLTVLKPTLPLYLPSCGSPAGLKKAGENKGRRLAWGSSSG